MVETVAEITLEEAGVITLLGPSVRMPLAEVLLVGAGGTPAVRET